MSKIQTDSDFRECFDGTMPLPAGLCLSESFKHAFTGESSTYHMSIHNLSGAEADIQEMLAHIERESLCAPDMPFREFAGFYFVYADGTSEIRYHTSDHPEHITHQKIMRAAVSSRIFDELDRGAMPQAIVHAHSHPGPEFRADHLKDSSILINARDFMAYRYWSSLFSFYAGDSIPVKGMVRPVGGNCGDVYIQTSAWPDGNEQSAFRDALMIRDLRTPPGAPAAAGQEGPDI